MRSVPPRLMFQPYTHPHTPNILISPDIKGETQGREVIGMKMNMRLVIVIDERGKEGARKNGK